MEDEDDDMEALADACSKLPREGPSVMERKEAESVDH